QLSPQERLRPAQVTVTAVSAGRDRSSVRRRAPPRSPAGPVRGSVASGEAPGAGAPATRGRTAGAAAAGAAGSGADPAAGSGVGACPGPDARGGGATAMDAEGRSGSVNRSSAAAAPSATSGPMTTPRRQKAD